VGSEMCIRDSTSFEQDEGKAKRNKVGKVVKVAADHITLCIEEGSFAEFFVRDEPSLLHD
jgi:hypothetical protein